VVAGLPRGSGYGVSEPRRPTVPGPPGPPVPSARRAGWTDRPRYHAGRGLGAGSALSGPARRRRCPDVAVQEQQGGYLTTGTATYSTSGYALTSNPIRLHGMWGWPGRFAGEIRIRVTATSPGQPVFVAIGPAGDVSRYLGGVRYTSVTALGDHDITQHPGTAVPVPPVAAFDWAAQAQVLGRCAGQ
jgi:hypothetical protein